MTQLFNRQASISIGSPTSPTVVSFAPGGLRIVFDIHRNITSTPNTCDLSLYNLNEETRSRLARKADTITINAGYAGNVSVVFIGRIATYSSRRDGADVISSVLLRDKDLGSYRIHHSFAPNTSVETVATTILDSMQLAHGNILSVIASAKSRKLPAFTRGYAAFGSSREQFDKLMDSLGITWSVQNGALRAVHPTTVAENTELRAPVISASTGMIGSPERAEDETVTVQSLLIPYLLPGDAVIIDSVDVQRSPYKAQSVSHTADTHSESWYTSMECQALNAKRPASI